MKTYKSLLNIGRHFCIYNTNHTGRLIIYRYHENTYAKTRMPGITVNGVDKLIACKPVVFGLINGYKEI